MTSYELLLKNCDAAIRIGRPQDVKKELLKLQIARIPRKWRVPLAKICRRSGFYSLGLSILAKVLHEKHRKNEPAADDSEIAEYAVLLLRYGAISEAVDYLRIIDVKKAPQALLYRAYSHFLRWEFPEAIPHLEQFLRVPLDPYLRLVAQTNLAYALVECRRHEEALTLLNVVIAEAGPCGYLLLESNCRAYRAQTYFQQNDIARAQNEIESAKRQFDLHDANEHFLNDHFLILKWELILRGLANKDPLAFSRLRDLASKNRDWAAYREADLYALKVDFSQEKFLHLYFGSPYPRFRDQITTEFGIPINRHCYVLGPKHSPRLDLRTGKLDEHKILLSGTKSFQLVALLLQDFYEPLRVASIFSALNPGEHFDVATSPDRVHKTIRRARHWLQSSGIPVEIHNAAGFYSLKINGSFSFRIWLEREIADKTQLQYRDLQSLFPAGRPFSAKELREKMGLSKTTARRLLDWAVEHGSLHQLGTSARDARYEFRIDASTCFKKAA